MAERVAENLGRQWIGIDVSPTACRVMAKRMRDVCRVKEDEKLWRIGRGFVVRDLPWSEKQLREIPHFEFENWAVMMREERTKGFFVSFDYTADALHEIGAFFRRTGRSIVALTVKDILEEQIAFKLA